MKQFLILLVILFVQETVTLNGVLVKAHQGQFSLVFVTGLFMIATIIDIIVGHFLSEYIRKDWNKGGIKLFAKKWSTRLTMFLGEHSRKVYLLLLGYFSFPYLNAFITAWLGIPFWESFCYLFIGNMLFYASCVLLVLGVSSVIPNPFYALVSVLVITALATLLIRHWKSRKI